MVAPPEVPRNASRTQSKGRTKEAPQRGQEHYKGRSPVGHWPGRLLQRCYKSAYRG
jgi:hypothetical protein